MATKKQEKLKLYELPEAYREIDDLIAEAGGEITDEIAAKLDALDGTLRDKVDAIGALVTEWNLNASVLKVEIERLQERKLAAERAAKRIKDFLMDTLDRIGRDKVKGATFTASVCSNSAPSFRFVGTGEIPEEFTVTEVRFSATKAKEAFEAGKPLPEDIIMERGRHVRIG